MKFDNGLVQWFELSYIYIYIYIYIKFKKYITDNIYIFISTDKNVRLGTTPLILKYMQIYKIVSYNDVLLTNIINLTPFNFNLGKWAFLKMKYIF